MQITGYIPGLSPREKEILGLIAQGLDSGEIATKLFISPHTVRTHRKNILRRTGAKKMTEAVMMAVRDSSQQTGHESAAGMTHAA